MEKDLNEFLKDPAGNYNTDIGDLVPHGIVNVAGISLLIFDPRHEWPLLYGSSNANRGVVPIAYNGQVNASAHYDAVIPVHRTETVSSSESSQTVTPDEKAILLSSTTHNRAHRRDSGGDNSTKPVPGPLDDCVMLGQVGLCCSESQ
jgi:hypothetical protein